MRHDNGFTPREATGKIPDKVGPFSGVEAFGRGIGFVITTPRVWGYALVPVTMMILLSCGLTGLGIWGSHHLSTSLFGEDIGTWGQVGKWSLTVVLALVGIVAGVLVALSLAQPLSGFALEAISHAQEIALTGRAAPKTSFVSNLLSTTKAVLVALMIGLPVLTVLFLISFFFPPAAIVTVPLKLIVCGWMLAWDFIDYPLAMRGVGLERRFAWVGRNFGAFTLFGLLWALMVVLPGVVLLVLPMGVAGATRLVVLDELVRRQPAQARKAVWPVL
jgi:CysZ protein